MTVYENRGQTQLPSKLMTWLRAEDSCLLPGQQLSHSHEGQTAFVGAGKSTCLETAGVLALAAVQALVPRLERVQ